MKIELLSITTEAELHIERCGRTCYQSADKITVGSAERFIRMIIESGHESVIEHAVASFRISGVSRALSHQLVRHRVASFSQQSQRYCKEDPFEYVTPPSIQNARNLIYNDYVSFMEEAQKIYNELVALGIKPEDARFVLPNACCTELVLTCNFREWRHIFKERCAPAAQWEIRQMCKEILKVLKPLAPTVFEDFNIDT